MDEVEALRVAPIAFSFGTAWFADTSCRCQPDFFVVLLKKNRAFVAGSTFTSTSGSCPAALRAAATARFSLLIAS